MLQGSSVAATLLLGLGATLLLRPGPIANPEVLYREALTQFRNGDFLGAASLAGKGWRNRQTSDSYWRLRLLEAESLLEGGKAEAGLDLLKADLPVTSPEFEIGRRVLTAGWAEIDQKRRLFDEARELAQRAPRSEWNPEIDLRQARLLTDKKEYGAATAMWEHARRAAQENGDAYREASAWNGLGMMWLLQSRWEEAIPMFEQALRLWRGIGAHYKASTAGNNISVCYAELGDFEKADHYRNEAIPLMRPGALLADTLGEAGNSYILQGLPNKGIPLFRKGFDMARQFGRTDKAARWAGNLTRALIDVGDWDGAEQALKEANSLKPEERSLIYLEMNRAHIAAGRKRWSEARAIYERGIASEPDNAGVQWDAYAGIAYTWAAEGNTELANRNFDAAIRVIEESQSDLRGQEFKITFLARLIRFYQDYVDALMTENQPVKALAVADSSRARVLSQRFDHNLPAAPPHQQAEFEAIARKSGSIWLSYWMAPKHSYLWVTTPKEIRQFTLPGSAEIAGLVEEYRHFVESTRDPLQIPSAAGQRLYEILIAPAAGMLPPRARVIIVPDGPLHQLSFETLPVYGGAQAHYWIEDAAVSVAPSFGVFLGEPQRHNVARKSLLIGDTLSPGPDFPPLDYAASEIAALEKHLSPGVTKFVRANANPDIWKQSGLGSYDIIHFAAHAEAKAQDPLDSAIILSPSNVAPGNISSGNVSGNTGYRLDARRIINVPLHADLVTLSACRSSGARTYAGEGLVGLTWAFLLAGSRNVVAGLWDVDDESTSRLMDRFYAGIAKGIDPAEALRAAQLDLLHGDYPRPANWGPFQCYRR